MPHDPLDDDRIDALLADTDRPDHEDASDNGQGPPAPKGEQPPHPADRADADDRAGNRAGGAGGGGGGQPSQADRLVELAQARYRLARTERGEPFGVPHDGPAIPRMLRGEAQSLRAELAASYTAEYAKAPSSQGLADALTVLEGQALTAPVEPLELRVARCDEGITVDLGDDTAEAAVLTPTGWRTSASPVLFRRTPLTAPMPRPRPDGRLDALRELINVSDDTWPLLAAWLVAALIPDIPHPIPLLTGEQGTGKSTAARMLAGLVDPSPAQLRTAPRDVEGWVVAASGSWIVPLDNVSTIPEWLSDALCRAVTGDGLVRRQLYTSEQLSVLSFRRVIMLTAIDPGALRGDLADRLLTVDLERIPPHRRRLDHELERRYLQQRPTILGGLFDLACQVLAVLPTIDLDQYPRMADFAEVVAAVDQVLGTEALATYVGQSHRLAEDVVEADRVAAAVRALVERTGGFEGTAAELLERITPDDRDERRDLPRDWPTTPQHLGQQLKRAAPALRAVGIAVDNERNRSTRRWVLYREAAQEAVTSVTSVTGQAQDGFCDDGLMTGVTAQPSQAVTADPVACPDDDGGDGDDGPSRSLSGGEGSADADRDAAAQEGVEPL